MAKRIEHSKGQALPPPYTHTHTLTCNEYTNYAVNVTIYQKHIQETLFVLSEIRRIS
jgi:hypothetical protein